MWSLCVPKLLPRTSMPAAQPDVLEDRDLYRALGAREHPIRNFTRLRKPNSLSEEADLSRYFFPYEKEQRQIPKNQNINVEYKSWKFKIHKTPYTRLQSHCALHGYTGYQHYY